MTPTTKTKHTSKTAGHKLLPVESVSLLTRWRPAMGWHYIVACSFDFVLAPILWGVAQLITSGRVDSQWQPITLQGAGLYHIAMGAVLGITSFGRSQEKINGVAAGTPPPAVPAFQPPTPVAKPVASKVVPHVPDSEL